jgi:hypothetical protein
MLNYLPSPSNDGVQKPRDSGLLTFEMGLMIRNKHAE